MLSCLFFLFMKYFIVDAFTDKLFTGNPAAVCLVEKSIPDKAMQLIAREFNLPETAFIEEKEDGYGLRWFTPYIEVDLCGHATLAAAHVLMEAKLIDRGTKVRFHTRCGVLSAAFEGNMILMDFPREEAVEIPCPEEIVKGLKVEPLYSGRNRFDYIVEVESEHAVRNLNPDFGILSALDTRGIIVTSKSESGEYDFISRFFAPRAGIPEDPVTGSAHCCLCPYWAGKLRKNRLTGYQASPRGGTVEVELIHDRVILGGKAVKVSSGELLV